MSDFGAFLNKVAGKVVNAANSSQELMCLGKCDKITKHISISYADVGLSIGNENDTMDSFMGTACDLSPLVFPLSVGNPYACICCNKIRYHGGALSSQTNENSKSLYLKKK
jgi:hypothetical protein